MVNSSGKEVVDTHQEFLKGNQFPSVIAFRRGYIKIDDRDSFNFTLLHHCCSTNKVEFANELLNAGADPNALNNLK
jgi:ankyrin repeat protein